MLCLGPITRLKRFLSSCVPEDSCEPVFHWRHFMLSFRSALFSFPAPCIRPEDREGEMFERVRKERRESQREGGEGGLHGTIAY